METKNKAPWQIIVISVIDFILALASPLINMILVIGIMTIFSLTDSSLIVSLLVKILFGLQLLLVIAGIYLIKGKNQARQLQIFILILFSLISIIIVSASYSPHIYGYLYFSLPVTLICLAVASYLLFNKKVKQYFNK